MAMFISLKWAPALLGEINLPVSISVLPIDHVLIIAHVTKRGIVMNTRGPISK